MGQPVAVTEKQSRTPGVVRFEANRSFNGMGHERFSSPADAYQDTPSAAIARRLFATGKVDGVHVYSNMVTVDIRKGFDSAGLANELVELYQYWKPGMQPPAFEDLQPDEPEPSASEPASGGDGGEDGALAEAAKLVPMHLLERSRAARERWKATHG